MSNRESARRLREGLEQREAKSHLPEESKREEVAPKEETPLSEELQKGKSKKGGMNGS